MAVTRPPIGSLRPCNVPFSGTCDANGNFSLRTGLRAIFWTHTKMAASVSSGASAAWIVKSDLGPLGFSQGLHAEVSPILLAPGDLVTIQIIGAAPGAIVTGQFVGAEAASPEEAMAYTPQANTVALNVSSGPQILGIVNPAVGATQTLTFPIPPGTVSIGYAIDFSGGNATPSQVVVTGVQTQNIYRNDLQFSVPPVQAALLNPQDTVLQVAVTAPVAARSKVWVLAWTIPVTQTINEDLGGTFSNMQVTFLNATTGWQAQAAPWMITTSTGPTWVQSVSMPTPLAWQAPNVVPVDLTNVYGAGGNFQVLAGTAGQTIRIWSIYYYMDAAAAVGNRLRIFDGQPGAGGVQRGTLEEASTTSRSIPMGGVPLTAGNGLWLQSDAAATVGGVASLSKG